MNNLTHQTRTAIERQRGDRFQEFINYLLIQRYGTKFKPNNRHKDKGSDGFINNTTALAVYAPYNVVYSSFMRKIRADHKEYEMNWWKHYPKWCFIYNGEFTGQMRQFIISVNSTTQTIDITASACNF